MRYRVLGPLEVTGPDGSALDVGGAKPRALLTLLLADAGRVVGIDRIVSTLWGDDPPPTVTGTLQAYVSHLRRVLEPERGPREAPTVLLTRPPGYLPAGRRRRPGPAALRRPRGGGRPRGRRPGTPRRGVALLDEALALWRGEPLAELGDLPTAGTDRLRLTELQVRARERRCDALLALGRPEAAVPDLQHLVAEHPLRERLWARLVTALYAADRQAEALDACRRCAELLREELGIDPGPELRDLEQAVLRQDPKLLERLPRPRAAPRPRTGPDGTSPGSEALVGRRPSSPSCGRSPSRSPPAAPPSSSSRARPGSARPGWPRRPPRPAAPPAGRSAWSRCADDAGAPALWPWTQVLEQLDQDELDPVRPRRDDADAARFRLFQDLRARLTAAADRPVLVVLDDLQGADTTSVQLLGLLARHLPRAPVLLVVTARTVGEELPEAVGDCLARLAREPAPRACGSPGWAPTTSPRCSPRSSAPRGDRSLGLRGARPHRRQPVLRRRALPVDGRRARPAPGPRAGAALGRRGAAHPAGPAARGHPGRAAACRRRGAGRVARPAGGRGNTRRGGADRAGLGGRRGPGRRGRPAGAGGSPTRSCRRVLAGDLSALRRARRRAVGEALDAGARRRRTGWSSGWPTTSSRRCRSSGGPARLLQAAGRRPGWPTARPPAPPGAAGAAGPRRRPAPARTCSPRSATTCCAAASCTEARGVVAEAIAWPARSATAQCLAEAAAVWGSVTGGTGVRTAWSTTTWWPSSRTCSPRPRTMSSTSSPACSAPWQLAFGRPRAVAQAVGWRAGTPSGRALNNFSLAVWGRPGAAEMRLAAADEALALAGRGPAPAHRVRRPPAPAAIRLHLTDLAGFEADHDGAAARGLAQRPEVRPHVLWQAGGLAWLRGDAARAEELTTEAYELFRRVTPRAARLRGPPVHPPAGRPPAGRRASPCWSRPATRATRCCRRWRCSPRPSPATWPRPAGCAPAGGARRPRLGQRRRRPLRRSARCGWATSPTGPGDRQLLPFRGPAGGARDAVALARRLRRAARAHRRAPRRPRGRPRLVAAARRQGHLVGSPHQVALAESHLTRVGRRTALATPHQRVPLLPPLPSRYRRPRG